jgi:hypothetical protein
VINSFEVGWDAPGDEKDGASLRQLGDVSER